MRITIESDPGYAGRAMAKYVAGKIRAAVPEADIVVVPHPERPRLPANYAAIAPRNYVAKLMARAEAV